MTLSIIVLLCALFAVAQSGKVQPIGRTPILVSSNNINQISSYQFTFTLDTPTDEGDLLIIQFPLSQYSSLVANTTCSAYLKPESFRPTQTTLDCYYSADNLFEITLVELDSGSLSPHSVVIENIKNPSTVGGTGNFQVETRRGLANTLDYNGAFEQLGFVAAPTSFGSATVTLSALTAGVNQNGTYTISLTTTQVIPTQGYIVLTFPTTNIIYPDFTCSVTPSALNCTRLDANNIQITNFSASVPVGSVSITLTKVLNFDYAGSSGTVLIQTWTNSVKTILESKAVAMPAPSAGAISASSAFYTNFQKTGLTLVPNDYISYEVSFRVVNPVPSTGAVQVTFPMAPTYCVPYSGLNDISETALATCSISGNTVIITSFKSLAYNQLVTIMIKAVNPSTTGPTSSLVIKTFKDSAATMLIDQLTSGFTFTIDSSLTKMQTLSLSLATYAATAEGVWTFNWQTLTALTAPGTYGTFAITLPSGFTFDGAATCTLKPAGGSASSASCSVTNNVLTVSTSTFTSSTFSNTADNTLTITGANGGIINAKAGQYPVIVKFSENGSLKRTHTLMITITSATTLAATITPLTLDRSRYTYYEFAFTAPTALSAGIFPEDAGDARTTIRLEFQTASGTTALFAVDLGRNDTTSGSTIPCYGADALQPYSTSGSLTCNIYFASSASSTTPVAIEVHDFASISSGQTVTLQVPKLLNSDSRTTAPQVSMYLKTTQNHITTVTYQTTLTLAISLLDAVVGSPYNTNGVNGISTNLAPTFTPSTINSVSRAVIKLTPGSGRSISAGAKIILDFPAMNYNADIMHYIFSSSTRCEIGLGTNQACLVFPEVGWIVIKNLASAFTAGTESTITLYNINNPPSASALNGSLRLVTIATNREYEEYFYTTFSNFKSGGLSNINVFPSAYEANQVDVEYNWIFVTSNYIPEGGSIQLRFPPNSYNLNSDPPVTGTVISGLSDSSSASISYSFLINVVTVKNFAAVPAGTLIRFSIDGVRNPIEAGKTTNFGIVTQDSQGYTIDSETLISGMNILTANPVGIIVFNYFYVTPSNGYIRGNYYLSFYPQTDYPSGTTIQVIFPSNEFPSANWDNITCSISGALTTFDSCTPNATTFTYEIVTDTKLEIEPGMQPINLFFPHIKNFNEELSSGVIQVRAVYDGVILDESGNAEDNRKATTTLEASDLAFSGFKYTPTTEGQTANYTVKLLPAVSFDSSAVIQFEFPYEYQRGLGDGVECQVPDLQISGLAIICTVEDYIVNITNHKGYDATTGTGFTVSISGIVNPNKYPIVNGTIAVFILTTASSASEYVLSLGGLTFTSPPQILDMTAFAVSSNLTRILADYTFTLAPTMNIPNPAILMTEFDSTEYNIEVFSKNPTLILNSGTPVSSPGVEIVGNLISYNLTSAISSGTSFTLGLTSLCNPMDEGEKRYPAIYIMDTTNSIVDVRTYDNLIKPLNVIFSHGGEIILLNDDNPTTIYPGQANKYLFTFTSPTTLPLTITPTRLVSNFTDVSAITVPVGATQAEIWIGVDSEAVDGTAYIEWTITGDTANRFWVIRPLEVDIVDGQTEIFADEVVHVPAGGRTSPLYVTLSNSPLTDLTVLLYQRGSIPTYVNVFPSKLVFKKGELSKPFWVSSGKDTKGIMGSIMFLINGTNADAYYMPKRLRSFIVSRGDSSSPLLFYYSFGTPQGTSISVSVTTSEPCTVYYFVAPRGTLAPLFEDIKEKKIRYDYYGAEYVVGEYVDDNASNTYDFVVRGLRPGMDYDSYFFIEDFSGNLGNQTFTNQFTTLQDYPRQVWMSILQSSLTAANKVDLLNEIASMLDISVSRLELDTTVLNGKTVIGDTSVRFDNTGRPNRRVKLTATGYTAPAVGTGESQFTFIVFPPVDNSFELSNAETVTYLAGNLSTLNSLYSSGGLISTTYGVKSTTVEPDDIKWAAGITATYSSTTTSITISGLALNAAGKIHALAIVPSRPVYYSTQDSLSSSVRYLLEDPTSSMGCRERYLTSAYGQQVCVASADDEVTVDCSGADLPAPDRTRDDYDFFNTPPLPSSYTVAVESDGSYFKGDGIATVDYTSGTVSVTLSGLQSGTTYTVYVGATDAYTKYPERMMDSYIITSSVTTVSTVTAALGSSIMSSCLGLLVALFGVAMML